MNELIKKIAAALGLGEDADEEQILTALSACVEENKALKEAAEGGKAPGKKPGEDGKPEDQDDGIVANKSVCELLGLKAGASTADVAASIMALKGGVDGRVKALEEKLADRDAEEAVELVGHAVGGVCPFAVNEGVDVYLDESLKRFETVFPACGSSNSAIELTIPELEANCDHFQGWVDVCKIPEN